MTKDELEDYARDNRDRLQAQEVKLGDEVKMLKGQFAGETGVVVGLQAFREDISDPYYEVDMNCEIPDKYKCRKTLLTPNNIIGGVSAYEFEVMFKEPTAEPSLADEIEAARLESLRLSESARNTLKAHLDDTYWQHYRAEIVKGLVLEMKTLTSDCADLIVNYATRIVDNLKKVKFQ